MELIAIVQHLDRKDLCQLRVFSLYSVCDVYSRASTVRTCVRMCVRTCVCTHNVIEAHSYAVECRQIDCEQLHAYVRSSVS